MNYHYGQTIKEYRIKKGWSISKLASEWPSKQGGVTPGYISDIERGIKKINDIPLLRELARLLDIPLYKFGLTEFNPFLDETEDMSSFFDSEILEEMLKDTWIIRLTMPVNTIEEKMMKLSGIFDKITRNYPSLKENKEYLRLFAQLKRLQAVLLIEKKNYASAMSMLKEMKTIAEKIQDTTTLTIALMSTGNELIRNKENELAFRYLGEAYDLLFSFNPGKELISLVSGMFARLHASVQNTKYFENLSGYAVNAATSLNNSCFYYNNGVYHSLGYALEQEIYGYILLNQGEKAIRLLPDLERQIKREQNNYLSLWYLLDYSMAFSCINEIEESISFLQKFHNKTDLMQTSHMKHIIYRNLQEIETRGYKDLPCVKDFREQLREENL